MNKRPLTTIMTHLLRGACFPVLLFIAITWDSYSYSNTYWHAQRYTKNPPDPARSPDTAVRREVYHRSVNTMEQR